LRKRVKISSDENYSSSARKRQRLLAAGSGDRFTHMLSDLVTCSTIQSLRGERSTDKCVSLDADQPDLLSTGDRDGLICIWDLVDPICIYIVRAGENRTGEETAALLLVLNISAAHEDAGAKIH
jgi:denticleless